MGRGTKSSEFLGTPQSRCWMVDRLTDRLRCTILVFGKKRTGRSERRRICSRKLSNQVPWKQGQHLKRRWWKCGSN
jgi:hypothetical protein